jgi:predicted ATP-dependent protease
MGGTVSEVSLSDLRPRVDPRTLGFQTTAEVPPHVGLIGQEPAIEAIKFGLSIESKGFNICVSGEPGTGRTTAIREYLESYSATRPPSSEFLYVNNFAEPHEPRAIEMPPGEGAEFAHDMRQMVQEARTRIPQTFTSEDVTRRRDAIVETVHKHREQVFSGLAERARRSGFLLQGSPTGFFLLPLAGDQPISDQDFAALPEADRAALMQRRDELMKELGDITRKEQQAEVEATARLQELEKTISTVVVDSLITPLLGKYEALPEVVQYLQEVRQEMIDHIGDFRPQEQPPVPQTAPPIPGVRPATSPLRKYEVNLLVDCAREECATVIFESNPSPQRLFGRIEKEAVFGALTTDFTMISPGSLHRANGGFLVFDFDDMAQYPLSWNELKRTIRTGMLTIEEMGERLGYLETRTIRPQPIPWRGKIIAIARESVYRTLYSLDPDFRELFKVKADFDMHIARTPEHELEYAGLISAVTRREGLPPLDAEAVALVIEQGMRMAEDHSKLSIKFGEITDIVREACHWARLEGDSVVRVEHIRKSIEERVDRVNLIEEHVREAMDRHIIVVATEGEAVGQVNGLSVVDLGDTSFGQPSRITASMGVGREGLLDLQREARLSGPIHSKAVLTLQGFLVDRFAQQTPLTLAARISFEQSYGLIEGDSATVAEAVALLSRIAGVPVNQSYAVTGSMDQHGSVQAIGGVNQKIEGFYDVCRLRGLTGGQGVLIPASNVQHLVLREDVVQAITDGKFSVHAVSTIDDALELLTGAEAGEPDSEGQYPEYSLNGRVQAHLKEIAMRMREYSQPSPPDRYGQFEYEERRPEE